MENHDDLLEKIVKLSKELQDINFLRLMDENDMINFKNSILERLDKIEHMLHNDHANRINKAEKHISNAEIMIGRVGDRISFLQGSLVQSCLNKNKEEEKPKPISCVTCGKTYSLEIFSDEDFKRCKDKMDYINYIVKNYNPDFTGQPSDCILNHFNALKEIIKSIVEKE